MGFKVEREDRVDKCKQRAAEASWKEDPRPKQGNLLLMPSILDHDDHFPRV